LDLLNSIGTDMSVWDAMLPQLLAGPRRTTLGGQPCYSDLAIKRMLTLRLLFHLALRHAEAFAGSVLRLLGVKLAIPDHSTLSRRGRSFAGRQPRSVRHDGPVHRVRDSTGLQLFGQDEWDAAKHGRTRRRWRKLHVVVDAVTGEIAAHVLTENNADEAVQTRALLGQAEGVIASVTAGSAYDREPSTEPRQPASTACRRTWSFRGVHPRRRARMTPTI
jgi:hypothetical protein